MKVLSYIIDFLFEIRRASDECAARHGDAPCPVQEKLQQFDVYAEMMRLSKRSTAIKRVALSIMAAAILVMILLLKCVPLVSVFDEKLAKIIFLGLLAFTLFIVAECILIIAMLSTGQMKPKGKGDHGKPRQ